MRQPVELSKRTQTLICIVFAIAVWCSVAAMFDRFRPLGDIDACPNGRVALISVDRGLLRYVCTTKRNLVHTVRL